MNTTEYDPDKGMGTHKEKHIHTYTMKNVGQENTRKKCINNGKRTCHQHRQEKHTLIMTT